MPDLVVEENGKFSVQSSSDEKLHDEDDKEEEEATQMDTEPAPPSVASTSLWSMTQTNTDDYKVSLLARMMKVKNAQIAHNMMGGIDHIVIVQWLKQST